MKEKISRLARGIVEQTAPVLKLSETKIEETIASGRGYRGDFRISSANALPIRGLVYSSDFRVVLNQSFFTGQSALISYEISAERAEAGDVVEGAFSVVSSAGEYRIPYRFTVQIGVGEQKENIETAEQFLALAQEKPDTALQLFESAEFSRLPFMQDLPTRAVYDGLRSGGGRRNAMEEFLTGMGLKDTVMLRLGSLERVFPECPDQPQKLVITRNTWGYISASLTADAPFLRLEKESLTASDFSGNECTIRFSVDSGSLHQGQNYGRIRLTTLRQTLELPVTVVQGNVEKAADGGKTEYTRHLIACERAYLDYQAGCGEKNRLLNTMQSEWDAMAKLREPDLRMRLWQAEMAQAWGRREIAGRVLEEIQPEVQRSRMEDPNSYCYFMYLQMCQEDNWEQKELLLKLLDKYQEDGRDTPTLSLLQLRIDEGKADQPAENLKRMRQLAAAGCRSPYLFLEACRIYNRIPELLEKLGSFERMTLWFGAKHGYLKEALIRRTADLAQRERNFQPLLYRTLCLLFEANPMTELLLAVCSLLIRGDRRDSRYFPWFERGVEEDVGLTKLYDYYLYTLPADYEGELPQVILLYYSYNSPADLRSRELLYDNILTFFPEDSQMYQIYERQMQEFSVEQLLAGNVDDFLAKLYARMLYPEMVDERIARILPDVICSYRIQVENPNIQHVVAVYGELSEELMVPLRGGIAYVPIYTDYCRLLFADAYGNRYTQMDYRKTELMPEGRALLDRCYQVWPSHSMLKLAACDEYLQMDPLTPEQLSIIQEETQMKGIHPYYQKRLISSIIRYYSRQEKGDGSALMLCVDNPYIGREDRVELIQALISKDLLKEALRQIRRYGYLNVRSRSLLKLCSLMICNQLYEKDSFLVGLAYTLFSRGQYDDTILQYLCLYYNGLSCEMKEILRRGVSRNMDISDLSERLFGQMLFSGETEDLDEIFRIYVDQGPADKMLIQAYYVVQCDLYFMKGRRLLDDVYRRVRELAKKEAGSGAIPVVCMLALTLYYSRMPELEPEDRALCQMMVNRLYHKGLIFPYFKKLGRFLRLPDEICDKTLIEFRGQADDQVEISYRILPDMEGKEPMRMEMPHIYQGIFVKPVLLFSGDWVEYTITIRRGKETFTQEDMIWPDITEPAAPNRFAALNRLVEGAARPDDPEWQEAVVEYAVQDTLVEKLFCTLPQPAGENKTEGEP